jgi:hypothetical protein
MGGATSVHPTSDIDLCDGRWHCPSGPLASAHVLVIIVRPPTRPIAKSHRSAIAKTVANDPLWTWSALRARP